MLLPIARADHMRLFYLLLRINYFAYALYFNALKSWESELGSNIDIHNVFVSFLLRLKLYYFYYYKTSDLLASTIYIINADTEHKRCGHVHLNIFFYGRRNWMSNRALSILVAIQINFHFILY